MRSPVPKLLVVGPRRVAIHIKCAIKARRLTQAQAAEILGLDQPKVSAITSGRLEGFSTARNMRFLNELGCDVKISVSRPHPDSRGQVVFTIERQGRGEVAPKDDRRGCWKTIVARTSSACLTFMPTVPGRLVDRVRAALKPDCPDVEPAGLFSLPPVPAADE